MGEEFALIRKPEADALKSLSSNAAKALIAIKFGRRDGDTIAFGVRDLEVWGLARSVAARALDELIKARLLDVATDSAFGKKRCRRVYRITHTRQTPGSQSRERDNMSADSPACGTKGGATDPPAGLSPRLQSRRRDTSKEASSPSARKPEGEEASVSDRRPMRRAAQLAGDLQLPLMRLVEKAGGSTERACDLADQVHRGELTLDDVRLGLGMDQQGSASRSMGPMVFTISAAGAR